MTAGGSKKTIQIASFWSRISTWAAGLLLFVALLTCLVSPFVTIYQARQPFPGFLFEPNLVVSQMTRTGWAGSALAQGGTWQIVRAGDCEVQRPADLYSCLQNIPTGTAVAYTVFDPTFRAFRTASLNDYTLVSPAAAEVLRSYSIPVGRLPTTDVLLFFGGPYLVALTYLACGLWIYRARRDEPAGRACTIACAAAVLSLCLALDFLWGHRLYRLWIAGLPLTAAGTFHMGLVFPEPLPPARRVPWIAAIPYLLAGALIGWGQSGYAFTVAFEKYLPFWKPAFLFLGAAEIFLLGSLLYTVRAGSNALLRRQARSVLTGGMLAFLPAVVGIAAILARLDPAPFFPLIYLAAAAFPLTLAFAIARRNLFSMERSLRRGLTNVLLTIVLAGLYIAVVYLFGSLASGFLRPDDPLTLAFLVILAALVVSPAQHALSRVLDRLWHQEPIDFRQAVQDFALAQVIDLSELSRLILQRIAKTLDLDAASLYLFEPLSGTYRLHEAWKGIQHEAAPAFAETDRFIQRLRVAHGPVSRFDISGSAPTGLSAEEQDRVDRLRATLFLPLMARNRLIGWINLGTRRSGEGYCAEDEALLGALADRAAVAIENARLFADRERRLTELAVLNEIGQAINSAHSLEQTLETIYRETGRLMDTTNMYIALYDPAREEVSFPLYISRGQRVFVPSRRLGNGLTEHILRTQQPLLIAERVADKVRDLGLELHGEPSNSWLGVPILRENQAIGVIAVQSTDPESPYDVEDLNILTAIANQSAVAIENARLYEVTDQALARRLEEITVLSDFARTLATVALDPAQVAEQTLGRAVETLQARAGILIDCQESGRELVPLAQLHWPEIGRWPEVWRDLLAEVFACGEPCTYRSDVAEARVLPVAGAPVQLLCPLIREDTPLALLQLALPEDVEVDEERRRFLRYLADHAAIALENALLYQKQVQQGAILDRRARHLAEILNLGIAIRANMDLEQVLQLAVQAVRDTLEFRIVLISLVDEKDPTILRRMAATGIDTELFRRLQAETLSLNLYQAMMQPEIRVGHSYILRAEDTAIWEKIRSYTGPMPVQRLHDQAEWSDPCTILTPLRGTADRILGMLTVSRPADRQVPGRDVIEILEIMANHVAVAVENARLYQALRAAYETKGEFLSLVAHELQVPMGTLWGYADLLDQEITRIDPHTLRGFVQVLKSNIAHLDTLVRDLLEVSRAEAGTLHMERVPLDVGEVVLDSIATWRPLIERKGLTLTVDAPLGLAPVLADRDRLGQVVDNLLSNACKYTPAPGQITIRTRLVRSPEEMNGSGPGTTQLRCPCLLLSVQDTGIGISRAEQKRIFTRFFRSEHPLVRQETGTGLGLYLVRLLVELQGGQVWLDSDVGQGSRFYVALPLVEAE